MSTIVPNGEELAWSARYWRYRCRGEEECGSLEEAINFLYWGEEAGTLSGDSIVGPDGRPVAADWGEPR